MPYIRRPVNGIERVLAIVMQNFHIYTKLIVDFIFGEKKIDLCSLHLRCIVRRQEEKLSAIPLLIAIISIITVFVPKFQIQHVAV